MFERMIPYVVRHWRLILGTVAVMLILGYAALWNDPISDGDVKGGSALMAFQKPG